MYKNNTKRFGNKPSNRFGNDKRRTSFQGRSRNGGGRRQRGGEMPLDITAFIRKSAERIPEKVRAIEHSSFSMFNLDPRIQANLQKRNYLIPTPIQDQAMPAVLNGKDIIGLASTGTGKTGVFLLPLINKVLKNKKEKVLILAPTRELALQIEQEFRQFAWGLNLFSTVCVGGMPIFRQIGNLKCNPNFVIGTPGRLKDLSDRGNLNYSQFNNVVLDEVDHMLDMGFIEPITEIMNALPTERQTLFFSATLPPRIRMLTQKFLREPEVFEISAGSTAKNVEQDVVVVKRGTLKFDVLHDLLSSPDLRKVLIFSETKRDVEKLTIDLQKKGHRAISIHGDKRQRERAQALNLFSNNTMSILVATDVAARGLDIKEISHVINYTIPQTYDDYIHRIGRTGRGSCKGKALTFV